jgi:hypothetical protein
MNSNLSLIAFALIFLYSISFISLASALIVDADYVTIYPGQEGDVDLNIENNENFDIEEIIVRLDLSGKKEFNSLGVLVSETPALPFSVVGSSSETIDDINEDDDDSVSFTLKANTDITPGDYNIPYTITYFEQGENEELTEEGSFGIRVSAKTELDFSVEVRDNAIVGEEGQISLEIINMGLGEIKSLSVQVTPQGFELLSKDKIFVGTIDSDDTDLATFDVIYTGISPVLKAKVTYKDFDNNDQVENINIPFKVYTREEALQKGIIQQSNTMIYLIIIIVLIAAWFVYRRIRKARKKNNKKKLEGA